MHPGVRADLRRRTLKGFHNLTSLDPDHDVFVECHNRDMPVPVPNLQFSNFRSFTLAVLIGGGSPQLASNVFAPVSV